MTTTMNMIQAINDALRIALESDPSVLVFGEDVGKLGGVFRTTQGLQERFGEKRVFDTPLSEEGIVGAAIGMALYGMRPVPEIQFADFVYPAYDEIVNEAAKMRYRSAGDFTVPMTIRMPFGGGIGGGLYHSQSPESAFIHVAGLTVVAPSTPHDAKGLLLASIRSDDPVIFMEPKRLYRAAKGEVPEGDYTVPLRKAALLTEGEHVTVVSYGGIVPEARKAVDAAAAEGVRCDLIDLRTLWPLDVETLGASIRKTGRLVVAHEAPRTLGLGAELAALAAERWLVHLEAPVRRVTGLDTPFPYALERDYLPGPARIAAAILETARF